MSRPSMTTPVRTVITILDAIAEWALTYEASIARLYGPYYNAHRKAKTLSELLDARESTYLREQREDVGHTNERDEVVAQAQTVVSSGLSLGRITFDERPNAEAILRDFASDAPSRIRSPQAARAALARLKTGFEIHREPMARRFANLDEFDAEIDEAMRRVDQNLADNVRENQETREAREQRNMTRREAVKFVRDLHLAAEAVEVFQPKALRDLSIIFETHNPTRSSGSVEEDDDLVGPSEDSPTPADEPTPAGDAPGQDAPVDGDPVDAPTDS